MLRGPLYSVFFKKKDAKGMSDTHVVHIADLKHTFKPSAGSLIKRNTQESFYICKSLAYRADRHQ